MNTFRVHRLARCATLGLLLTACGTGPSIATGTTAAPVSVSTPESTVTTSASSIVTTSLDTTTTTAPDPSGAWAPISFDDADMPLAYPCCASNWGLAEPSPPLPAAGQPLADGVYSIEWEWPVDMTTAVTATVSRFDRCSVLPPGNCQEQPEYFDDEFGVAAESVEIELRFDDALRVVLGGYVGFDYTDKSSTLQIGSGTALADLISHLEADFQAAVVEPVAAGADPWELAETLGAAPEHGFSLPLGEGPEMHQVVYTYLDAPPLLFQALIRSEVDPAAARGSDNIGRIALRVDGGVYTVSVYSGWYS